MARECAPIHRACLRLQGCAPIETVITLLVETKPIMFKIFKPIEEVGPEEMLAALRAVLESGAAAEHQTSSTGS